LWFWGFVFLNDSHFFEFKEGMGRGTNDFAELLALKFFIFLATEKGVKNLQVFGDSLVVID
jgi:ribonuclease HI